MESSYNLSTSQKSSEQIVQDINSQLLKAIPIIQKLEESYEKKFSNTNIPLFDYRDYEQVFKDIIDNKKKLETLAEQPYNKIRLMVVGDTNVGKSTLSCTLANGKYFQTSNKAETYCTSQLYSDTSKDAKPFKIVVSGREENNFFREELLFDEEKEFIDKLSNLKRKNDYLSKSIEFIDKLSNFKRKNDNKSKPIELIQIYVKDLSKKSQLLDEIIMVDTAGVGENKVSSNTYTEIYDYWRSSIVLIVVNSCCGTLQLNSIEKLLDIFKKHNRTEHIIFVFTHVINHIQQCIPEFDDDATQDPEITAIPVANETLKDFQKQIEEIYPKASFAFYERDYRSWNKYYYNRQNMEYMYTEDGLSDVDKMKYISIGKESICYLKDKINTLAKNSIHNIIILQQENKLEVLKSLKAKINVITTKNKDMIDKMKEFNSEIKGYFDEAIAKFKNGIDEKLDFDPSKRKVDSPLKASINNIFNQLNKSDKETRINKDKFQKYLINGFISMFNNYLDTIISGIYESIYNDLKQKITALIQKSKRGLNNSKKNSFSNESDEQLLRKLIDDNESLASFGGIGLATANTLALTYDINTEHDNKNLRTIAGCVSVFFIECLLIAFLNSTSGVGLLYLLKVNLDNFAWSRSDKVEEVSKIFYEKFINNQSFREKLENAGTKVITDSYSSLEKNSLYLFVPKEENMIGNSEEKELESIIQNTSKLVEGLRKI